MRTVAQILTFFTFFNFSLYAEYKTLLSAEELRAIQALETSLGTSSGGGDEMERLALLCDSPANIDDYFYIALTFGATGGNLYVIRSGDSGWGPVDQVIDKFREILGNNGEFYVLYHRNRTPEQGQVQIRLQIERRIQVGALRDKYPSSLTGNLPTVGEGEFLTHCRAFPK